MAKYGPQRKRRQRKEEKASLAAQSVPWSYDRAEPVDRQDLAEEVSATSRVTQRTVRYQRNGMLVEFAVVYSVLIDGMWIERLCIDTCNHGAVHRHRDGDHRRAAEIIRPIDSPQDVQECFWDAVGEAYDQLNEEEGH